MRPRLHGLLAGFAVALSLALAGLFPGSVHAIDGTVTVTDSHQNARAAGVAISTSSRRDILTVGQRIPLASRLFFDARFRTQREISGTKVAGVRLETERITHQPSFLVNYRERWLRVSATGSWYDRRVTSDTAPTAEQTRSQFGAAVNLEPTRSTDLTGTWNRTATEQTSGLNQSGDNREQSLVFGLEQRLPKTWSVDYRFSARSTDAVDRDIERDLRNHFVELAGTPRLAHNRVRTSWRARSQFFHQRVETGTAGVNPVLIIPLSSGLALDDTPEVLDPLEDDPTPVPGLFDGDLDEATPIDIGDDASVVREFGGDYRNIILDLGEPQEISGAVLYVDRRLLLPEVFEWHVFVTDDPEGREWTELVPTAATVAYQEFGGIRQGWEVTFPSPVVARSFKMVDVKLGESIPQLFVTELELFRPGSGEASTETEDSQSHRVDASIDFDVTSGFRVGVQSSLRRRTFEDSALDLDEMDHTFRSQWTRGRFAISGRYGIHRLWSDRRNNTDTADYGVTARQEIGDEITTTVAWSRTVDLSDTRDQRTDTVSLIARWRPTSRLNVTQRVARGTRTDVAVAGDSRSIVTATTFRGSPFRTLSLDLDRTDRWVDQESGTGFARFSETSLSTTWVPVPLIRLNSFVSYQRRSAGEWVVRNTASWSPFAGGRLEPRFIGSVFSDTRSDNTRYSAQSAVKWKVHRRLTLDGSVETSRVELAGETTTPVSTRVHLLWAF